MEFLRVFYQLFKPRDDLSRIYAASALPEGSPVFAPYPQKDLMSSQGIYAYRLQFMVLEHIAKSVFDLIATHFKVDMLDMYQEGHSRNDKGESIHFSIRHEFNGAVVELVTNSIQFLMALDRLCIKPPPPWIVFPNADPETLGGRQGSMDYWWTWFWSPFWDAASQDEKMSYLKDNHASADWLEYINAAHG